MHGQGTLLVPEELQARLGIDMFAGKCENGRRSGEGSLSFPGGGSYEGQFLDNMRHGHGTLKEKDSSRYEGPWERDGPGTGEVDVTYPSGFRYVGSMQKGARHGDGRLIDARGREVYSGHWQEDDAHGPGDLTTNEGQYVGEFARGMKEGNGCFQWTRSSAITEYSGQWRGDKADGIGTVTEADGFSHRDVNIVSGEFQSVRPAPPPRGLKEKYLKKIPPMPKVIVKPAQTPKDWPRSSSLFSGGIKFSAAIPKELEPLEVPSGVAHGRSRAAHMGIEGIPHTRWA